MQYCQSNTFLGCILTLLLLQSLVKTGLTSTLFKWKTGPWGECMDTRCGPGGSQLRSVFCENQALYYKTRQYNCNTKKPHDKRECFKVCDEHQNTFNWVASSWQDCNIPNSVMLVPCGESDEKYGVKTRFVFCANKTNPTAPVEEYICARFHSKPLVQISCTMPCPLNCVTGEFSNWSKCSKTCGNGSQTRIRHVLRKPQFGGDICPSLVESKPCIDLPRCQSTLSAKLTHQLKFTEWSVCKKAKAKLKPFSKNRNNKWSRHDRLNINHHLIGLRRRLVQCLNSDGYLIGTSFIIEQTCAVSQRCTVSLWTEWTTCKSNCGNNGTQIRTRKIKRLPFSTNLSSCPVLNETRYCVTPPVDVTFCKSYGWASGDWSSCELIHNASCGGGLQWRDVYCVQFSRINSAELQNDSTDRTSAWVQMQPVEELFCNADERLHTWRECNITCHEPCVMGDWSDWSLCALPKCPGDLNYTNTTTKRRRSKRWKGFQRRVRPIYDDQGSPEDCPHTIEVIPCDNSRCFHWKVVGLSACKPHIGLCGNGIMDQQVECRDMWGKKVAEQQCLTEPLPNPVARLVDCHVPCPGDCVLSMWSSWTPCPHTCKGDKSRSHEQIRKRSILALAGPGKTPCPRRQALSESRRCNQNKCSVYFWEKSKWQSCQLEDSLIPIPTGLEGVRFPQADENNGTSQQGLVYPGRNLLDICVVGYQTRSVRCSKKDSVSVRNKNCIKWDKPTIARSCVVGCRQDCVLSHWSQWSSCSDQCRKLAPSSVYWAQTRGQNTGGLVRLKQVRRRFVVQHRLGSGEPCRLQKVQERDCSEAEQCSVFKWHTGIWSPCVLAKRTVNLDGGDTCRGIQTRSVKCRVQTLFNGFSSANASHCFQIVDKMPHTTRSCYTECRQSSKLQRWLRRVGCKATLAPQGFGSSVTKRPTGSTTGNIDDAITYVPKETEARPIGPWSSCLLDQVELNSGDEDDCPINIGQPRSTQTVFKPKYSADDPVKQCGNGRRKRALGCFEKGSAVLVDISHCLYQSFTEEECQVPCPEDCVMTEWAKWGQWGQCGKLVPERTITGGTPTTETPNFLACGNHVKVRVKFRLDDSRHGGRACPLLDRHSQLRQWKPCRTECDHTFWVTTSWETCLITNQTSERHRCGSGFQTQAVQCYQTSFEKGRANFARILSDPKLCDWEAMPVGSRSCEAPCPQRCVVSAWSAWSQCQLGHGEGPGQEGSCQNSTKRRRRYILRQPGNAALSASVVKMLCPEAKHLSETEDCELNKNCFTYSASWTHWSSCLLNEDAQCGAGRMYRSANCVKSTGLPVHVSNCEQHNVSVPQPQSRECRLPCPIDCLVADWSLWAACPDSCAPSVLRTRSRKILRKPSNSGRLCPSQLEQYRPCCSKPCYSWNLTAWQDCWLPTGTCGVGEQRRSAVCLQHDGSEVDHLHCTKNRDYDINDQLHDLFPENVLVRSCKIPCQGDCQLAKWSLWSNCHASCYQNGTKRLNLPTVKTRSRVGLIVGDVLGKICNKSEIEEKECPINEAHCFTYVWKTGAFAGNKRPVWCERVQDALPVSFGCLKDERPLEVLTSPYCKQPCDHFENSFCLSIGVCGCVQPYHAVMQDDVLLACVDPDKQQDQGTKEVFIVRGAAEGVADVDVSKYHTTSIIPPVVFPAFNRTSQDFWDSLNPISDDGSLKIWAYGAIAALAVFLVFVIATSYLLYSACHRVGPANKPKASKQEIRRRRASSSGSNVGVGLVVSSGINGSAIYGTGGTGLPPYYTSALISAQKYPSMRALSRTPSARSGFNFPDQYDGVLD